MIKKFLIATSLALVLFASTRVEVNKGLCMDDFQNGAILEAEDGHNYISYKGTEAKAGDWVTTICIYTIEGEDVAARLDIVEGSKISFWHE